MQDEFKKIGIIYNQTMQESKKLAIKLNEKFENSILFSIDEMQENIDLAIVVGGDGTFLKASRFYSKTNIPVFGFNVGRLGYLSQATQVEMDLVIEKLKNHDYKIEERLMLSANNSIALNDIVIKGMNCARSTTFNLFINDKNICSYVADGLIVSTPTGSTAYSLSAGGPIISPEVDCFLIIPICPHTLNTRPLIVPTSEKIKIKNAENNQKLNVSYDGQIDVVIDNEITIEKNINKTKILVLDKIKNNFYDILRKKLHWSITSIK